ncbi:MAG TPA: hypothetical protein VMV92_11810 [Streptosporangiaceae bacterium]|nr:hypothetical protein [Streptosporangiaceae bacterium]
MGMHAVQLAEATRSSLVVNRLTGLGRELTNRHPGVPEVAGFHEQLRDYLKKATPVRRGEV